jgi:hypothetical protein
MDEKGEGPGVRQKKAAAEEKVWDDDGAILRNEANLIATHVPSPVLLTESAEESITP